MPRFLQCELVDFALTAKVGYALLLNLDRIELVRPDATREEYSRVWLSGDKDTGLCVRIPFAEFVTLLHAKPVAPAEDGRQNF
jgi:hypothetical protein